MSLKQDYNAVMRGEMVLSDFVQKHDLRLVPRLPKGPYSYYDCGSHASRFLDRKYGRNNWMMDKEIPWSEAKEGDWVTYDGWHHGIVVDPRKRQVESCWGVEGYVFQHPADHSPYRNPKVYAVVPKTVSGDRVASRYVKAKAMSRLRCQYDGDFYLMDLSRDRFVHFTTRDRAAEIMESGRLLMRPPYKKFGIDAVAAVSTVWGSFVPGVQITHIDSDKRDLVGVVFQTRTMPEVGYPEEVLWKQDVVLVNPKVVPYAKAKGMIRGSSDFDGQVYYAVPSWCDGVEGQSRVARVSPRIKEAIEESMLNLPENIHRDIESFAHLVLMGQAPSLEKHTSTLYKAFAPLRKALGGTTTMYRGQPIDPPKIERKWLSWTTEPRMAARFTGDRGDQIIEAKVKSSDVVAGILSPNNPNYIEFLVKNRPEYQTRSPKQVPIYYALYMPLNPRFYDDFPENYGDLSDREQLEYSYPDWKRWLRDNGKAVERAGGIVMYSDPPKMNPDEKDPFLGVLMPADAELPPALAALDDAQYGRPMPKYMGKVASAARVASRYMQAVSLFVDEVGKRISIPSAARVAAKVHRKGDRPKGTFYGDDDGVWRYTEGYPLGLRREGWNWSASIGLSSKNDWKNLMVDGASEQNRGFRKALREIVREYPEVAGYLIVFDGPYMPVSSLVGGTAPKPESRIDLGKQTYYHGTSSDVLDAILSDGLMPRGQTNVEPVFGVEFGAQPSRAEAVYLTTQLGLAQSAANSAARKRRSDPVIVEVTGLHHNHFQPDEDSRESDAVRSLERMGSVAYVGRIRPRNIRVYAIGDGSSI